MLERRLVWLGPTLSFQKKIIYRVSRTIIVKLKSCVGGVQYSYNAPTMRSLIGKGLECGAVSHPKKEGA